MLNKYINFSIKRKNLNITLAFNNWAKNVKYKVSGMRRFAANRKR